MAGFDDIRPAQFVTPSLTTVRLSQVELGRIAFRVLLTTVECKTPASGRVEYEFDTNLILRFGTMLAKNLRKAPRFAGNPAKDAQSLIANRLDLIGVSL